MCPALTCTTPSPAAKKPTACQPTTKETSPAQPQHWEGCAGFCHAGCRELTGIFLKIKAVSFPTCYSFGKRGQPARSTISQLAHARSSPLASDYRELHFGSWFF